MNKIMAAVAVSAVLSMGGCSILPGPFAPEEQVTGIQVRDDQIVNLKDHYSTTLAVANRLGKPTRTVQTTTVEQWYYDYAHTFRSSPQDNVSESVIFEFDRSSSVMTTHRRVTPMAP